MRFKEIPELRDPEKPHRRVFEAEDGTFVKVHVQPESAPYGEVRFTFSVAHCDSAGKAIPREDGYAIHGEQHQLLIKSDGESDVNAAFSAALEKCVNRIRLARQHEAMAARAYLGEDT